MGKKKQPGKLDERTEQVLRHMLSMPPAPRSPKPKKAKKKAGK